MTLQLSPYILPLLISAAISAALGAFAWRRRRMKTGAAPFAWMMFAGGFWALVNALLWATADARTQYLWLRLQYVGIEAVPVLWLIFAAEYTQQDRWLTPLRRRLLAVPPAFTLLLVWTNSAHSLIWTDVRRIQVGESLGVETIWGPAFWVQTGYAYLLLFGGVALIVRALLAAPQHYRGRVGGLVLGVLSPWLGNALYLAGWLPFPGLDPTPFLFALSGLAFGATILPNRIFDVIPYAFGEVIGGLTDGVLVLDVQGRLVDANPAALSLLGGAAHPIAGQKAADALPGWPGVQPALEGASDREAEVQLRGPDGASRPYGVRVTTLSNPRGEITGNLVHLRDISAQVQMQADLARTKEHFYAVMEDLEDSYFEADLKGRFVYANRAFCDATGYPRQALIGSSFRRVVHRQDVRRIYELFAEVIQNRQSIEKHELAYVTRDGLIRHAELSVSIIQSGEGGVAGTRGIIRDVTERLQMEAATRRAKEAAEKELEIGRQIQSGFFPNGLPQPEGWELAAHFHPARQVAGDFYDAFLLDDGQKLAIVVADVCDKGVGAALFMALFRSLIRVFTFESFVLAADSGVARRGLEKTLVRIVSRTNDYIAETHGRSNMFATVFLGVLELGTGVLHYVNCGHDAPVVAGPDGIAARLQPTGPAVGMLPGLKFQSALWTITPGQMLIAFTDGVLDARTADGSPFSEQRLLFLVQAPPPSAPALIDRLADLLGTYSGGEVQFDDISLLALRRSMTRAEHTKELTLDADLAHLPLCRQFIEQACEHAGLGQELAFSLKLAVDEAVTNVIQHAYADRAPSKLKLIFERQLDKVRLTVVDWGRSFRPEQVEAPDLGVGWRERRVGGLGLHFIREMVDELTYEADPQAGNRLILGKFLTIKQPV